MKKNQFFYGAAMCGFLTLGSCTQEVINDPESEPNSRLSVSTRSGGDEEIAYPIKLYVFGSDDACKAVQTLESSSSEVSISLPAGSYDVYSIGGADATRYELPSQNEASKTSAITLLSGQAYGDLMMSHASITLSEGGTNSVELSMERKVIQIKSITINSVPAEATAVSVKISPLRQSVLLNGDYQGDKGTCTIALEKQADGTTWKSEPSANFQLPSVGNPTITVTIGNDNFSYAMNKSLNANHKLSIVGTYTQNNGTPNLSFSTSITGATWDEDENVDFNFDNDNKDQQATPSTDVPAVGSLYKGCYVLAVKDEKITLLSSVEQAIDMVGGKDKVEENIESALSTYNSENTIGVWRLPNKTEANLIINQKEAITNNSSTPFNDNGYFYNDNSVIKAFTAEKTDAGFSSQRYLRPVTTITIQ